MRINRSTSLMLSAAVAVAVAAPAAAQRDEGQSPQDIKSQEKETLVFPCESGDELIFVGDLQMWPPNHKYQDLAVTAFDADEDGDQITLTTRLTHDEYLIDWLPEDENSEEPDEEVGAGNTRNDASPFFAYDMGTESVTNEHEVRSERSGRGDGRTYTIQVDATFDNDDCSTSWEVEVPHDMRSHNAPAKQDKTDSTGPNQG